MSTIIIADGQNDFNLKYIHYIYCRQPKHLQFNIQVQYVHYIFCRQPKKKEVKIRHHFELHVKYVHYILQMANVISTGNEVFI